MSSWHILVGFDGSEHADRALDFAHGLAAATGARLTLACVYPFRPLTGRLGSGEQARELLAAARLRLAGACDISIIPAASVAAGLGQLADSEAADLVVLGARRHDRRGEVLPGRTALTLIADGGRPVAIVPRGGRPGPVRQVGVVTDGSVTGEATLRAGRALADEARASLLLPEAGGGPGAAGVDLLVVPAWRHGRLSRLGRRGRRRAGPGAGSCPVVGVPADVRLPARARVPAGRPATGAIGPAA